MKPFLLSLASFLISFNLPAQSDLQSDPDIEWIGAYTADYRFDAVLPSPPFELSYGWNTVAVEKLLMPPLASGFPPPSDATELFWKLQLNQALHSREWVCFEDPELKTPMDEGELYGRLSTLDTVVYVDDATKSTRISLVRSEAGPEAFHGVRVYQQLYLRKSTRLIGYRVVSWAPLLADGSKGRDNAVYTPICWLPAYPAEDSGPEEIPYVFATTSRDNSPALEDLKPMKGEMDWKGYLADFIREPWAAAYSTDGSYLELSGEDFQGFSARMDTVIVFDPETYTETVTVYRQPEVSESLLSLRLMVRWFWDDRQLRLYYEPVALAPVCGVYDEKGELMYGRALFYVKAGK